MDEEKFDELRQEFEMLKEEHEKLLQAFKLLRKKTDLQTFMIENINETQEEKWKKYDDLIEQFISSHDQSLEELQKAVEEFLEDE